jgi:glutamate/aspartate transport system substrate-binding protein
MRRMRACVFTVLALILSAPCQAQQLDGTLAKIAQTKTIVIGYRADQPPFSYLDSNGAVIGYSIDLCRLIAEGVRRHLGLDELKVEYVADTPATRFVLLKAGKIDLECAATTNNAERRKLADFSYPHFMTATQFVYRRRDHIETLQDLSGHTVASTSGTVGIEQLNDFNRSDNLNIAVIPTKSNEDAFNLVVTGRASAFVTDGIMLAALVANAPDPDVYALSSDTLSKPEPYGFMLRQGDAAFKMVVNKALADIFASPDINVIYARWFTSPTPPGGRNLNLPMSTALEAAFRHPVDYAD